MTLGVAWQKHGRGYRRLLPEDIITELEKIRPGRQRDAAIAALDRPWSMGATDFGIDESIIKKGGSIWKMQRELQEATQRMVPSPDFQLSVNGHPLQLTLILQVYPLVVNLKRRNAYYPLTVGFNVTPKVERGQNALALMQEPWAQPAKWSRQDQKEFWRVLFEALHKLGEELKPAKAPPVKEAVLTISAKLKVTVDPSDPAGTNAAVEKLMRQLGKTGQVVEMQHAWNGNSATGENLTSLLISADTAHTAAEKGVALERLMVALFQCVPGFTVRVNQRTETEEIDLAIINGSNEPRWRDGTPLILVECKNWSGKCGKNEIVQFRDKLGNRSGQCRLGFLVSWGGFAETLTKDLLRNSKGDAVIVPLERKDVEQACANGDVLAVLRRAWEATVLT